MIIEDLFIELVQVSIGRRSCLSITPTTQVWRELFLMSQKQALIGICFAGIQRLKEKRQQPDIALYSKWLALSVVIQQRNEMLNKHCILLQQLFLEQGKKSCILKGQGVALYYDEELIKLRQSGDIDVWVDASREDVLRYAFSTNKAGMFDYKHIHCNLFSGTEVELHWTPAFSPVPWINRAYQRFFKEESVSQFNHHINIEDLRASILTPDLRFNAVYLLMHIFEHFLYEGIGMRQFMDLYFVLKKFDGSKEEVMRVLRQMRIQRFAQAVMYVMKKVFDLPHDLLLCKVDEKLGNQLLLEIHNGGNFGFYSIENNFSRETWLNHSKRRICRRIRLLKYDVQGLFWRPVFRLRLALWKRKIERKYK